jgi:hypothetical protein
MHCKEQPASSSFKQPAAATLSPAGRPVFHNWFTTSPLKLQRLAGGWQAAAAAAATAELLHWVIHPLVGVITTTQM